MNLRRTKTIEQSIADTEESEHQLRKRLGPLELTVFGVGVIIGTGIFVLTGEAAGAKAGPAVALSFVASGIVCALAALCYAEFASTVPVAGSAYTFSYASLGELIAWTIGWDLILELALGASTVAVGWSTYFADVMEQAGITLPASTFGPAPDLVPNLVAPVIVLILTGVICLGIKVSSQVNFVMVVIKLAIVLLVIFAGLFFIKSGNYSPFIPPSGSEAASGAAPTASLLQDLGLAPGAFGVSGIFTGAALVFFAYIGFDIVATAAEETKNPQRDMPIGILGGLAICTVIYVIVGAVATGLVPYQELKAADPLTRALQVAGLGTAGWIVAAGAVVSLTAVLLVFQYGQPRIFFAMARDGLLPRWAARVHGKSRVPHITTWVTGLAVAFGALFADENEIYDLTNIGTLSAFAIVCIGVLVLRIKEPNRPRPFRVPFVWPVTIIGAGSCVYIMLGLPAHAWKRFAIWLLIGLAIYVVYGYRNSVLRRGAPPVDAEVV